MPRKSVKETIVEYLIDEAAKEIVHNEDISGDDEEVETVLDELEQNLCITLGCRVGISGKIPSSSIWRNNVLTMMDDTRFRTMLRVSRKEFSDLVNIIKDDVEFNKAHSCKQYAVELQLALVLFRVGSSGESGTFRKIASLFGVGDGGTISVITTRIFKVILKLQDKYIYWPNEAERLQIVADHFNELPFCIGYIDGTEVKFAEAPVVDDTTHFSRNRIYCIKAQVVCDPRLVIRHVVVGHPGSWHDARIYRNSSIFKQNKQYFSSQQWIAGDSAYPLSTTLITPYRSNAKQLEKNARIRFNLRHSQYRVRIEHCFGVLKERFGSLKELRMRLSNKENHKLCCDWFLVCCILHNISKFRNYDASWLQYQAEQLTPVEDLSETDKATSTNSDAEMKRQAIYSLINS